MPRRIHLPRVNPGEVRLPDSEAHHLRDVLRMREGDPIEAFDDAGNIARGTLLRVGPEVVAHLTEQVAAAGEHFHLTVASAVPKGNRADWMIEKLSELGVHRFIPLEANRSVVVPEGKNKLERWQRLATEAAKQSKRAGVMQVEPVMTIPAAMRASEGTKWCLSTGDATKSIFECLTPPPPAKLTLFVGPEGGWTTEELAEFTADDVTEVSLTQTILRIETAAMAAAAVLLSRWSL